MNSEVVDQRVEGIDYEDRSNCNGGNGGSNAARYKLMSPARLPISRSHCLTIPPGLSPTSLLDSPVLLSNIKAEPSPTTGTFNKPQIMYDTFVSDGFSSPRDSCNTNTYNGRISETFEFKPHFRSATSAGLSSLGPMVGGGSNNHQGESFGHVPGQFQPTNLSSALPAQNENMPASSQELALSVITPTPSEYMVASRAIIPAENCSEQVIQKQVLDSGVQETQFDNKETSPFIAAEKSSEDGYNWRKYGQKHVKGCEFPRSYYKCTHPNCQVKKQLERSHDGQITEIIYKGKHDHPKPQPSRRMAVGTIVSVQDEGSDRFPSLNSTDDKLSNVYGQTYHQIQPNGSPEFLPVTASDDNLDGTGMPSNGITKDVEDVDDDDDPESKRRKKDSSGVDVTLMAKAAREPRVVVQTLSEVDILDDGYRWRKYGQKVVKGNPNPRSYYKCTNAGCPVRKHVERASHDPKAVITTYEGKHNHDVPAAKTNAHDTAAQTNLTASNIMLRTRSEEIDTISLDLGVGITSSPENRSNEMQLALDSETNRSSYSYLANPGSRTIQAYSGCLNDGTAQYGSREIQGESFSFETQSLSHSSNPYQQNLGRLMMER